MAPEECLASIFKASNINYISADLSSYAMLQMDLTNVYFPDETFDVVYASHVLEHIVDDRKAMREIHRILKPDGWAILQVPIMAEMTYENPGIVDPKERERVFGQSDHVRIYGLDYYTRLTETGFRVHRERIPQQQIVTLAKRLGIFEGEEITFCAKM